MKSRTSFFNPGICRNTLKRCWPLWTTWFVLLLFALPVTIQNSLSSKAYMQNDITLWFEKEVLTNGILIAKLSFAVAIIAAMAVFSFLYSSRTCGMMCSLPVKRECLFTTSWLTGIVPLLAAELLTAVITCILFGRIISAVTLLKWFAIAAMGTIAFYGFASFCAMLTGSLFVLPLVYAVLNFTAVVVEGTANVVLKDLIYGFVYETGTLSLLSPLVGLTGMSAMTDWETDVTGGYVMKGPVTLSGVPYLVIIAVLGLVFSVLALLLFRKRKMETASDTVAIAVLKPVFKYCMAFGCALVFCAGVSTYFLTETFSGAGRAAAECALLLAGGFIGYFAALMMIKKTLRVFRGNWKGFAIVCAVCAAFTVLAEADVTGYEKRLPDMNGVKELYLDTYYHSELREEDNLELAMELHRSIIENKSLNESSSERAPVRFNWVLDNGDIFSREYNISCRNADVFNESSDVRRLCALESCPEAAMSRIEPSLPVNESTLIYASVWYSGDADSLSNNGWIFPLTNGTDMEISTGDAVSLYYECILPDVRAGRLGNESWLDDALGVNRYSGINLNFELREGAPEDYVNQKYSSMYLNVLTDSTLTLERLKQLTHFSG